MNALRAFKDDYVSFARRTDAAERKWDEDAVRFAAGEFIKLHENGLATDFETEGSVEEVVSYIAEQFNLRLADVESRVREHIAPLIDYTGETVGRSAGEKNVSQIYGRVAVTERPLTDLPEHEDFSLIAIDADGIHDDGASRRVMHLTIHGQVTTTSAQMAQDDIFAAGGKKKILLYLGVRSGADLNKLDAQAENALSTLSQVMVTAQNDNGGASASPSQPPPSQVESIRQAMEQSPAVREVVQVAAQAAAAAPEKAMEAKMAVIQAIQMLGTTEQMPPALVKAVNAVMDRPVAAPQAAPATPSVQQTAPQAAQQSVQPAPQAQNIQAVPAAPVVAEIAVKPAAIAASVTSGAADISSASPAAVAVQAPQQAVAQPQAAVVQMAVQSAPSVAAQPVQPAPQAQIIEAVPAVPSIAPVQAPQQSAVQPQAAQAMPETPAIYPQRAEPLPSQNTAQHQPPPQADNVRQAAVAPPPAYAEPQSTPAAPPAQAAYGAAAASSHNGASKAGNGGDIAGIAAAEKRAITTAAPPPPPPVSPVSVADTIAAPPPRHVPSQNPAGPPAYVAPQIAPAYTAPAHTPEAPQSTPRGTPHMPQGGGERAFRNGDAGEGALPRRNDAAPYSPPAPREREAEFKLPEQRGPAIPERKVEIWHVEPDKGPIQVERLPDRPSDIGEPKDKNWSKIIVVHPSDPNDSKFKKEFGKCAGCDGTKGCCPTEGIIFKGPVMTRTI